MRSLGIGISFLVILFLATTSCDFYTAYIIKKSLEGDFEYINKFSDNYELKGDNASDIVVSKEEKILPEFVEDKISPLESEQDMFPSSKEKPVGVTRIFTTRGENFSVELPDDGGVWIAKKFPVKIADMDRISSSIKDNRYVFITKDFGKDNLVFQLFSSNGTSLKIVEYEIVSTENDNLKSGNSVINTNAKGSGNLRIQNTNKQKNGSLSDFKFVASNRNDDNDNKLSQFDTTDNEKEETNDLLEPNPPSGVAKMDLKSLVGDEVRFFESIDNIAKKYGYYRALKEIEKIEANISQDDLPKLKLKKMEILGKLNRFSEAIKEGEPFVDRDNFIRLYTGIFFGRSKNYSVADRNIREALQRITLPRELSLALDEALSYYSSIPEVPTREMITLLLQKNEMLQKDYKNNYYRNLMMIGGLFERVGEIYKARSIYEQVYNSDVSDDVKSEVELKISNLDRLINYK
ncbi:MAG: hypothetical protein RMJ37_02160 [Spirochaetia bacterium]|nr:hypothetical protein [Spirochaetota bacterium]MDW8112129.1 hypothetical protein [Spirochaetia bacterium]